MAGQGETALAALELTVNSFAKDARQSRQECYAGRMQPQDGRLRIEGAAYPDRWTATDHKREEQRRARQRPPRPLKDSRTRGEKLREHLGAAV